MFLLLVLLFCVQLPWLIVKPLVGAIHPQIPLLQKVNFFYRKFFLIKSKYAGHQWIKKKMKRWGENLFFVAMLWHVTSLRLIPTVYIKVFLDCLSTSLLGVKITDLLNPQPHTLVDTHTLHKKRGLTNLCHHSVTPQDFLFLASATALCRYRVFIPDSHRISGWRWPPLTGRREKRPDWFSC